jgi:hypothetical protein
VRLGSGHLEIFVFRLLNKKKDSGIIGLVRPAGGHKIFLKLVNYDVKWTKRFFKK